MYKENQVTNHRRASIAKNRAEQRAGESPAPIYTGENMTVTCTICNKTEPTQEQFDRFHIPTHEHVRMMSAYEKGIEAGEYKQSAELARLTKENKWRKRDSEHLMELGGQYKLLEAEVSRLTAGSEAMQEDARNNTATINKLMAQLAELKAPIEDIKYYVGNPSAWEYYDDGVSEKIRAILKAAGMA